MREGCRTKNSYNSPLFEAGMTQKPGSKTPRPFWLNLLLLLGGTAAAGYLLALLMSISLSNIFFITGAVYLLISAFPIFTEMGGNARTSLKARREGRKVSDAIREQEESGRYSQGTRITFLFGISGMICFVLAILTL